jgi:hypothetical protein
VNVKLSRSAGVVVARLWLGRYRCQESRHIGSIKAQCPPSHPLDSTASGLLTHPVFWGSGSGRRSPCRPARAPLRCDFGGPSGVGYPRPVLVPASRGAVAAPVAQRIEHLTTDQKVGVSNTSGRATFARSADNRPLTGYPNWLRFSRIVSSLCQQASSNLDPVFVAGYGDRFRTSSEHPHRCGCFAACAPPPLAPPCRDTSPRMPDAQTCAISGKSDYLRKSGRSSMRRRRTRASNREHIAPLSPPHRGPGGEFRPGDAEVHSSAW